MKIYFYLIPLILLISCLYPEKSKVIVEDEEQPETTTPVGIHPAFIDPPPNELGLKVAKIFRDNCLSCHREDDDRSDFHFSQKELDGKESWDFENLRSEINYINSYFPEKSHFLKIVHFTTGTMPRDGKKLSEADFNLIKKWVMAGLPNPPELNENAGIVLAGVHQSFVNPPDSLFGNKVSEIFEEKCLSCHARPTRRNGGFSFNVTEIEIEGVYKNLYDFSNIRPNKAWINSFFPDQSQFLEVLTSGRMPKGDEKLSETEINLITTWIKMGLPNPVKE